MLVLTPNNNYVFETRHGKLDPSDDHNLDYKVIKETWVENVYRINPDQFYDSNVFLDLGANIGAVSLWVDSLNKDRLKDNQIKTIAVEPEPHNLLLLNTNIANNPTTDNLRVLAGAVHHELKEVEISDRGGNSSIYKHDNAMGYTTMPAFSIANILDSYNFKEADVCKIDIEGYEYDLIINTSAEDLNRIKYLTLEFDKDLDNKFGEMINKLAKQFGLQILGSPERGGYIYATRY